MMAPIAGARGRHRIKKGRVGADVIEGGRLKTWEEFRKAMVAIPLSDLCEEAAGIAKWDDLYAEIATLQTHTAGLTLAPARTTFPQRQPPVTMLSRPPIPQVALPSMAPPRYQSPPTTPCTPNRQPYNNTCM